MKLGSSSTNNYAEGLRHVAVCLHWGREREIDAAAVHCCKLKEGKEGGEGRRQERSHETALVMLQSGKVCGEKGEVKKKSTSNSREFYLALHFISSLFGFGAPLLKSRARMHGWRRPALEKSFFPREINIVRDKLCPGLKNDPTSLSIQTNLLLEGKLDMKNYILKLGVEQV